jgi:transposase
MCPPRKRPASDGPLPDNWDEQQIEQALFPQRPAPSAWRKHPEPEWAKIHEELQRHKDLTLQLVWQEGRESNPDGYGYSRYVATVFMLRNRLNAMTDARSGDVDAT